MLALDCLLIETLQQFKEGVVQSKLFHATLRKHSLRTSVLSVIAAMDCYANVKKMNYICNP